MTSMQSPFVGIALARMRLGVMVCCWLIGLSLIAPRGRDGLLLDLVREGIGELGQPGAS